MILSILPPIADIHASLTLSVVGLTLVPRMEPKRRPFQHPEIILNRLSCAL